jgi:hypothetical protein
MQTITDNNIVFTFSMSDLFNEVGLLSSFMAKSISSEGVDELTITEDEKHLFDVCVRQTLPTIYECVLKVTAAEGGSFESAKEGDITIRLKDNEAYNKNILGIIDATLYDCLKYGVLREFYSVSLNTDLYTLSNSKFNENFILLKRRLYHLRKKMTV